MLKDRLNRPDHVKARVAIISDVHITHRKEGYAEFEQTMRMMSELEPDGYVFVGDIVYMIDRSGPGKCDELYPVVYDYMNDIVGKYARNVPIVYTIGNHEYPQNNDDEQITQEARALFVEKSGHDLREHKCIGGYHFISMDGYGFRCGFTEETEAWAKKEIDAALEADINNPVFVVFHKPVFGTVVGSVEGPSLMSSAFREYLNHQSRIVCITGDLHTAVQDPKSIWQDVCTVIHTPMNAVGNVGVHYGHKISSVRPKGRYSQALLMDIYEEGIVVNRLDLIADDVVAEPWRINVNDVVSHRYTDTRFQKDIKPYFKDRNPEISYNIDTLMIAFEDAVCPENDIESFVQYYEIVVKENDECVILSDKAVSDYYLYEKSGKFRYTKDIPLEGKYTIEITPISSFYVKGDPLKAAISVREEE